MELKAVFLKLKDNLRFFRINEADIGPRHRILVDEAVGNLDCPEDELDDESFINISALRARAWEIIHTGEWSEVRAEDKFLYSLATYLQVLCELREYLINNSGSAAEKSQTILEHEVESLDMGILLGIPVPDDNGVDVLCLGASLLSRFLTTILDAGQFQTKIISQPDTLKELSSQKIEIPVENYAQAVTTFKTEFYAKGLPLLIRNGFDNWPATEKWKDVSYFQRNFGLRTIPVEIGAQYTTEDWGQQLMLFKDFIESQFQDTKPEVIQYLAQHNLFEQIPELKEDIGYPALIEQLGIPIDSVDTKIWLGPAGTISPLHFDKKENFLCQVIGWKRIVLICPEDSQFVYPFEGEMMSNTSQLDLSKAIDETNFPLADQARKLNVLLGPGQILYIPFGWWHYVTSLSPSISVSFWWNKPECL